MDTKNFMPVSKIVGDMHKHPHWTQYEELAYSGSDNSTILQGAGLFAFENFDIFGTMGVNFGALGLTWWRSARTVWQITEDTAKKIQETSINFLPTEPPRSWGGNAIIAESPDNKPLFNNVFSIGCYFCPGNNLDGDLFVIVGLDTTGAAFIQPIKAGTNPSDFSFKQNTDLIEQMTDQQKTWHKKIEESAPLDENILTGKEGVPIIQAFHWIMSLSYFLEQPSPLVKKKHIKNGALIRKGTKRKIARNKKGEPLSLWSYSSFEINDTEFKGKKKKGNQIKDKEGYELNSSIVRPHFRKIANKNKTIFIPPYLSHRWHNKGKGQKKKV